MSDKFKSVCICFKWVLSFILLRKFGSIIHDETATYEGKLSITDFRQLEKFLTLTFLSFHRRRSSGRLADHEV